MIVDFVNFLVTHQKEITSEKVKRAHSAKLLHQKTNLIRKNSYKSRYHRYLTVQNSKLLKLSLPHSVQYAYQFNKIFGEFSGIATWLCTNAKNALEWEILVNAPNSSQVTDLIYQIGKQFIRKGSQIMIQTQRRSSDSITFRNSPQHTIKQIKYISNLRETVTNLKGKGQTLTMLVNSLITLNFRLQIVKQNHFKEAQSAPTRDTTKGIILITVILQPIKRIDVGEAIKILDLNCLIRKQIKNSIPQATDTRKLKKARTWNIARINQTRFSNQLNPKQSQHQWSIAPMTALNSTFKLKRGRVPSPKYSLSESDSFDELLSKDRKTKRNSVSGREDSDICQLRAQNRHLRRKIKQMQAQFAQQSNIYVNRMKDKIEKLKLDNEALRDKNKSIHWDLMQALSSYDALKKDYQEMVMSRQQYLVGTHQIFDQYQKRQIVPLESQISYLTAQLQQMESQMKEQLRIVKVEKEDFIKMTIRETEANNNHYQQHINELQSVIKAANAQNKILINKVKLSAQKLPKLGIKYKENANKVITYRAEKSTNSQQFNKKPKQNQYIEPFQY